MIGVRDYFCLSKKYLVYNLTMRNLKIKYRQSALGYLWSLLVPTAQAAVYYLVFKKVLKVQIENYVPYILSGVLLWTFFANTLSFGMEGFVGNRGLLTKIPMPFQIFQLVETVTNTVTLFAAVPVLFVALEFSGSAITWNFLFVFYYVALLACVAYGFSIFLGATLVVFNDLRHVFSILIQLWMYGTPIFYHESMIPTDWKWLLALNPVGLIFTGMHQSLIEARTPDLLHLGFPLAWAFASLAMGYVVLNVAREKGIVELL